jgi:hypothetical protein
MSDLKIIGRLMGTVLIIGVTALLWLFLLEELGFGTWECWPG